MADEAEPPEELICPITQELFVDPVVAEDGNTYSRADLLEWFSGRFCQLNGVHSPLTREPISSERILPNRLAANLVMEWKNKHELQHPREPSPPPPPQPLPSPPPPPPPPPHRRESKRARYAPGHAEAAQLRLLDFPVGCCEVLTPRTEGPPTYQRVVAHHDGQLRVSLRGEPNGLVSLAWLDARRRDDPRTPIRRELPLTPRSSAVPSRARRAAPQRARVVRARRLSVVSACDTSDTSDAGPEANTKAAPPPEANPKASAGAGAARRPRGDSACTSVLRRSAGRTRDQLNRHLGALGLSARFGVPVVSAREGTLSHLTLNDTWNRLPRHEGETFEWWLGAGAGRLRLARHLDPDTCTQPRGGVPLFWAESAGASGGAVCRYVGHFACVHFGMLGKSIEYLERSRQALIELAFDHYDERLAEAIAAIPGD